MSRRRSALAILVLAVSLPVTADANCGCASAGRPCTQEVLAAVALPAPAVTPASEGMEFTIASCFDCDSSNPLPLLLWGMLFWVTIAVRHLVCGADRLIVFRLSQP